MVPDKNTNIEANVEARTWQRLLGVALLPVCLLALLALFTYDWRDIAWLQAPPNDPPENLIGIVGACMTFFGYSLLGFAVWLIPLWLAILGISMAFGRVRRIWQRNLWGALCLIAICALIQLAGAERVLLMEHLNIAPNSGGAIGQWIMTDLLVHWISPVGGSIVIGFLLAGAVIMLIGPRNFANGIVALVRQVRKWHERSVERAANARKNEQSRKAPAQESAAENKNKPSVRKEPKTGDVQQKLEDRQAALRAKIAEAREAARQESQRKKTAREDKPAATEPKPAKVVKPIVEKTDKADEREAGNTTYELPPIDLLDPIPDDDAVHGDVERTGEILVNTIKTFNVDCEIVNIECGPVITQYQLLPASGVRVERFVQLASTLQLVLKAHSIRVQAPIPGKAAVGIEVPNQVSRKVVLREILEGEAWQNNRMQIPLVLGKDVSGRDLLTDLTQAPHLLVAGATGSGKSVGLNAMLSGLLICRKPEDLKLILVDPKRVEFTQYNNLPHLLVPVITDPKKVAFSLRWALSEMDRRYKLLQATGQRNIVAYNNRPKLEQADLFDQRPENDEEAQPAKLPYIVIVIDEVADLMMTVGQEVEGSITRLAQLSRAVGIHMILATQRPSVNVITGTIKANFPGRIAFQVSQKVDSRTILDTAGAETLIGHGDMLFLNPKTSRLIRAQGALVKDNEIYMLTDFIKKQCGPQFDTMLTSRLDKVQEYSAMQNDDEASPATPSADDDIIKDDADEELLQKALQVIRDTRRASASSIQRRLRIGYNRAARIIDMLEERGIVGPPRGSDPREILVDLEAEMPLGMAAGVNDEDDTDVGDNSGGDDDQQEF